MPRIAVQAPLEHPTASGTEERSYPHFWTGISVSLQTKVEVWEAMANVEAMSRTPAFTVIRLVTLLQVNYADITYSVTIPFIFTGLEPTLAVALPCIPLLRPLLGNCQYSGNGTARLGATVPSFVTRIKTLRKNGKTIGEADDSSERGIRLTPIDGTEHVSKVWRSGSHSTGQEIDNSTEVEGNELITISHEWKVSKDFRV